jgi:predicted RecA/RadA family phage recombinase
MAENVSHTGEVVVVPAPANVNSGQFIVVGNLRGVAQSSAASGVNVAVITRGDAVLTKPNAASTSFAAGANIHWDATNATTTISSTSNAKIGVALAAATNTQTTARVFFFPQ